MTKEEEILRKRVCKDCIWEDMQHLVNTPMAQVYKAMNEYADIKVGEAIAGKSFISHEYEIPKHIIEEFETKAHNQAIDDAIEVCKKFYYVEAGNNPKERHHFEEIISNLQSLKK